MSILKRETNNVPANQTKGCACWQTVQKNVEDDETAVCNWCQAENTAVSKAYKAGTLNQELGKECCDCCTAIKKEVIILEEEIVKNVEQDIKAAQNAIWWAECLISWAPCLLKTFEDYMAAQAAAKQAADAADALKAKVKADAGALKQAAITAKNKAEAKIDGAAKRAKAEISKL